jgi:hypothetical protein
VAWADDSVQQSQERVMSKNLRDKVETSVLTHSLYFLLYMRGGHPEGRDCGGS